jgi:hypothetical protein
MTLIANIPAENQVIGALVRTKTVFVFGNVQSEQNSHGFIEAIGDSGATSWSLPLQSGVNDIATCATFDSKGHIWVVGTSGPTSQFLPDSSPSPAAILNPDSVVTDPTTPLRGDLTTLVFWELDQGGNLISTFRSDLSRSIVARGIIATSKGLALVGIVATPSGNAGFFLQVDYLGVPGALQVIGAKDTELSSIVGTSAGFVLTGSSVEKLLGKPLIGLRDAISVSATASGKISSILRSTNSSTIRQWQASTSSLFMGGVALASGKVAAVVTKFSSTMAPTWTARFSSYGPAFVVDAPLSRIGVFASASAIPGVASWKPVKASVIALGFDSKGRIQSAYSAKALSAPIALGYSTSLGLVVLGQSGEKGVSIFHALTR